MSGSTILEVLQYPFITLLVLTHLGSERHASARPRIVPKTEPSTPHERKIAKRDGFPVPGIAEWLLVKGFERMNWCYSQPGSRRKLTLDMKATDASRSDAY